MGNTDQNIGMVKYIAQKLEITDTEQHPYDLYQSCLLRVKSSPRLNELNKLDSLLNQLDGLILPPSPLPPLNEVEPTVHSVELYIDELRKCYPRPMVQAIDEAKELCQIGISALDGYRKSRYMELLPEDIEFLKKNVSSVLEEFFKTESLQFCCFRIGGVDDIEELYETTPEFDIDHLCTNLDMIDYTYWISIGNSSELFGILKDGRSFFVLPNFPKLKVLALASE
jgi:hypothetical protein